MFQKKSPVKKKFATAAAQKRRRRLDPRTAHLVKQGLIGLGLVLVFALLFVLVWYITRIPFLTINTVVVRGGETIDAKAIENEVNHILTGEYIGLVPRRFTWFYPQAEILLAVAAVPRVKDPQITRKGRELEIVFSEYTPEALWCKDKNNNECVFIDEVGYAFTNAPALSGGTFPRFHTIGKEPALKSVMLPEEDIVAVTNLRASIEEELNLPIAYVETDMMRDVFLGVAGGGEIKATLRQSATDTVENLRSILASKEFSDIKPGNFQYIDLRFGNKVFVNETMSVPTSTVATSTDMSEEVIVEEETNLETAVASSTNFATSSVSE